MSLFQGVVKTVASKLQGGGQYRPLAPEDIKNLGLIVKCDAVLARRGSTAK